MAHPKSPTAKAFEPARLGRLGPVRRGLTFGGLGLGIINVGLTASGHAGGGPFVAALLWGAAAVCFLGAFVAYMMEPESLATAPAASTASTAATAAAGSTDVPPTADILIASDTPAVGNADAPGDGKGDETRAPLLPRGNPLRWTRGGITAALGLLFTALLMAKQGQWRVGVPLGALFTCIAAWGVMDFLGTFDDKDERLERSVGLGDLAQPLAGFFITGLVFAFALGGAQAGAVLPQAAWGIVVTLSFIAWVAAFFALGHKLGPLAVDENGEARPLLQRHGFWVVTASAVVLFPVMGIYSLWDPWETHYGEVTREMLAKDD